MAKERNSTHRYDGFLKALEQHLAFLDTDEGKRFISRHRMSFYESNYQESLKKSQVKESTKGNPLWAWRAILECLNTNMEFPESVRGYLKEVAFGVWALSQHPGKHSIRNLDSTVSEILGFKRAGKKGRTNILSRFANDGKDLELASAVELKILEGNNLTDAIYLVATEVKISNSTVRRAWEKNKDLYHAAFSKSR